ncbi:MAG: hypothetical protein HRU12_07245 [Phaeodactylibacter sp.]|nr:hypothetical protein [Phaeodactylibacter sp.]
MSKRKTHSAKFKKRVALEAVKDPLPMAELSRASSSGQLNSKFKTAQQAKKVIRNDKTSISR